MCRVFVSGAQSSQLLWVNIGHVVDSLLFFFLFFFFFFTLEKTYFVVSRFECHNPSATTSMSSRSRSSRRLAGKAAINPAKLSECKRVKRVKRDKRITQPKSIDSEVIADSEVIERPRAPKFTEMTDEEFKERCERYRLPMCDPEGSDNDQIGVMTAHVEAVFAFLTTTYGPGWRAVDVAEKDRTWPLPLYDISLVADPLCTHLHHSNDTQKWIAEQIAKRVGDRVHVW